MYKLNEVLFYSIIFSSIDIYFQSNVEYCATIGQHNKVHHPAFLWSLTTKIIALINHPLHQQRYRCTFQRYRWKKKRVPLHFSTVPLEKKRVPFFY